MIVQLSLVGDQVKPWNNVCHKACWFATQEKCVCRCKGKYHGKGTIIKNHYFKKLAKEYAETFKE